MKFDIQSCPDDWVELKGDALFQIVRTAANKAGSINHLATETGVPAYRLRKFTCRRSRRINVAIKDLRRLQLYLEKHDNSSLGGQLRITRLGRNGLIINPVLRIDFCTPEGARLIADVLTDGTIALPRGTVEYMNTDEQEIVSNIRSMNKFFCKHEIEAVSAASAVAASKICCKVYKYDTSHYGGRTPYFMLKYPQTVGKFFLALGLPPGRKVHTNPRIPDFMFSADEHIIRAFLERVIINEGSVKPTGISVGHSIARLDGRPPNLVDGYIRLFNRLGIRTSTPHVMKIYRTQNGQKHAYWRIVISGRNLDIIRDTFDLHAKQRSIDRRTFSSRWKPHQRIEQMLTKIHESRSISAGQLAASLDISAALVSQYAGELEATGKVRRRKDGVRVYYELVAEL